MGVQIGFSPNGVFVLVPLIALVVLVIVMLVKKPKAGLIVLGSLVAVGVLGFFFFLRPSVQYREESLRTSAEQQSMAARARAQASRSAGGSRAVAEISTSEGPEWTPEANQFEADVYPSARAAAGALAGRVESQIDKAWQGEESPTAVTLTGPDWPDVMEHLKQALRNRWPQVKVTEKVSLSPSREAPKPGELTVGVRFPDNKGNVGVSGSWSTSDGRSGSSSDSEVSGSGRAILTVKGPGGAASAEAAFVDKPWADNLSKYLAEHPHPGEDWFVVSSSAPCASANEARYRANEEAARRLAPLVRQALDRYSPRPDLQGQALASRIGPGLQQRGFVQDQFLQRFRRPYGDVWKQSLLIKSSPQATSTLAAQLSAEVGAQARAVQDLRSTWARTALSIVGLVVLICLVYLFLNAVTKGYYAWPLRKAAVVVGLLALAAVFALLVLA